MIRTPPQEYSWRALSDEDTGVRCEVVRTLGAVTRRIMAVPLPSATRSAAVGALARVLLERNGAVPAPDSTNLARAVNDQTTPSRRERRVAHLRLSYNAADDLDGRDLAQVVDDPSWVAARALGEVAPSSECAGFAVSALTTALRTDSNGRRLRVIVRSLSRFGPAANEALPDMMQALRQIVAKGGASDAWLWVIADSVVRMAPGAL